MPSACRFDTSGISLSNYTGWGAVGTNLLIQPATPYATSPGLVFGPTDPLMMFTSGAAGDSDRGGSSSQQTTTIIIGSICGAVGLAAVALMAWLWFTDRRVAYMRHACSLDFCCTRSYLSMAAGVSFSVVPPCLSLFSACRPLFSAC